MKNLFILALFALLTSCNCVKKSSVDGIESVARQKFGQSATIIYNSNRTHALVYTVHEPDMKNPVNALNYGIYQLDKSLLVYSEQKYNASVEWFNSQFILIKSSPGVQSTDEAVNQRMSQYYIEVNTQKKYTELPN